MAGTLNQLTIIGNLGRDPEMSYSSEGIAYTNLAVATEQGTGKNRKVLWIRVVCFGKTAENMNDWLHKGYKVLCQGHLAMDTYRDKAGIERMSVKLVASMVENLTPRGETPKAPYTDEPPVDESVPF